MRGNRCDDASTAILGPQLPPARFQLAHTMPKTEPAQSPSFSSRRIATRLLIQMEVVLVAAACCRARKPPLKDGRTEGRTDCDRERCSLPPPPPLFLSALYIHPMLLHLTHSVPSSSSSSSLLFVPSLLLKCELNAFSLQSRRPTDRPTERVRGQRVSPRERKEGKASYYGLPTAAFFSTLSVSFPCSRQSG